MTSAPSIPELANFAQFTALKQVLLLREPHLQDLTETRVAKAMAPWLRDPQTLDLPSAGHRCHVAERWLDCFGLPARWKDRALVTKGVRHSLKCLFELWSRQGRQILVPGDVYPAYLDLACQAECRFATYSSFPTAQFEGLERADVVLVTNPVKPRGGELTAPEQARLRDWLSGDAQRRVVVDAVYTYDTRLSSATMALYASGQTLVLHSLSKGWARPLIAGIALVPASDVSELTSIVRAQQVDKEGLRAAQALLEQDSIRPVYLGERLLECESRLRTVLAERGLQLWSPAVEATGRGQYLFVVAQPWRTLLEQHGVLALPLSTFGSALSQYSVVSSLPSLDHPAA